MRVFIHPNGGFSKSSEFFDRSSPAKLCVQKPGRNAAFDVKGLDRSDYLICLSQKCGLEYPLLQGNPGEIWCVLIYIYIIT